MMQTERFEVTGMTCGGCSDKVTDALKAVPGVDGVDVSLVDHAAKVSFDTKVTSLGQLESAVRSAGYGVGGGWRKTNGAKKEGYMNHSLLAVAGSALLVIGSLAMADDSMMNHGRMMTTMQAMDTNGDGKISKAEYIAYYEKMWTTMKKDENGMVDLKSMGTGDGMMKDNASSKDSMSH